MTIRLSIIFAIILLTSCGRSGPATTRTNSSQFATHQDRVNFLNRYVTFRRTYETLDFDIMYQNNSDGVPAPSDYDIRIVATVPGAELAVWIPPGIAPSAQDSDWLKSVPTPLDLSGVNEWYGDGHRTIGIDRQHRIVVYRQLSS